MEEFNLEKYIKVEGEDKERIKIFQVIEEINELYDKLLIAANDEKLESEIKEKIYSLEEKLNGLDAKKIFSAPLSPREKEILDKLNRNSKNKNLDKSIREKMEKIATDLIKNNIALNGLENEIFIHFLEKYSSEMKSIQDKFKKILDLQKNEFSTTSDLEIYNLKIREENLLKNFLEKVGENITKIFELEEGKKYYKAIKEHCKFLQKNQNLFIDCQKEINEFLNLFSFLKDTEVGSNEKKALSQINQNNEKQKEKLENDLTDLMAKLYYVGDKLRVLIKAKNKPNKLNLYLDKYDKKSLDLVIKYIKQEEEESLKSFLEKISQFFAKNLTEITPEELGKLFDFEDLEAIKEHCKFLQKHKKDFPHYQKEINEFLNLFSFLNEQAKEEIKENYYFLLKALLIDIVNSHSEESLKSFLEEIGQFFAKNLTEITPEELKNFFSPEDLKIIKEHCDFLQKHKKDFPHCQKEINEFLNLFSFLNEKRRDSKK